MQRKAGAGPAALTPQQSAAVDSGVRTFMQAVSHDVTQDGPTAWRNFFADGPAFFMASEGKLQFASGAAAANAIQNLPASITKIQLSWGDDLRVDPFDAGIGGGGELVP